MKRREPLPQRLLDLAADRALGELAPAEAHELEALLAEHGEDALLELELAAAELELAQLEPPAEALPEGLHRRLAERGEVWSRSAVPARPSAPAPRSNTAWWLFAAAAVLAALGWWPRGERATTPGELYAALRADPEVLKPAWSATDHAPGASGDVAWSQREQRGVLRISGLQRNDPSVEQYQLWIFDGDQGQPIDGGVFDITGDEVLIEIDAKLAVSNPTAFAVTVEKPGGVVVSAKERVVLLAPL